MHINTTPQPWPAFSINMITNLLVCLIVFFCWKNWCSQKMFSLRDHLIKFQFIIKARIHWPNNANCAVFSCEYNNNKVNVKSPLHTTCTCTDEFVIMFVPVGTHSICMYCWDIEPLFYKHSQSTNYLNRTQIYIIMQMNERVCIYSLHTFYCVINTIQLHKWI